MLESFLLDVKYGARALNRNPLFTAAVVVTLSLGIGANTAIFSLMDSVMLRMLPVEDPEELYTLGSHPGMGTIQTDGVEERHTSFFSYPLYRDLRDHTRVFTQTAAICSFPSNVYVSPERSSPGARIEKAEARLVSGNYFSTLGVHAGLGRMLTSEDDTVPGGHPVVVISNAFWARRFGQSLSAVGRTLRLNDSLFTIVGVAPPEFFGETLGISTDIWVPMMMQPQIMREPSRLENRNTMWMRVIGRLDPSIPLAQAQSRTHELFQQLLREEAGSEVTPEIEDTISKLKPELTPFAKGFSRLRQRFSRPLLILMAVVGLVLLIACANVGNLLLARASGRQKEAALRLAIGSSRSRLIRQLLTESVMLALLGGVLGLLTARWAIDILLMMVSSGAGPVPLEVHLDGRVLAFNFLVSLLTALLFGLVPALQATRIDLNPMLQHQKSTPHSPGYGLDLRKMLVVSQVAISLLLLIGAGLFIRSLQNLRNMDPGFRPEGVLLLEIDPQGGGYEEDQLPNLYRELIDRVEAIPNVRSASLSHFNLFSGAHWRTETVVDGYSPGSDTDLQTEGLMVTSNYFDTVGAPLVLGRKLDARDREGAPKVAVVNETFAQHFFPGQSPLGKRFGIEGEESSRDIEVVGVVKDLKYQDLREDTPRLVYFPVRQNMVYLSSLEVRTTGGPAAVAPQVRHAVGQVAGNLPILEVRTLTDQVGRSLRTEKLVSELTGFFGLLALLLASIGIYGVMAYGVAQRTNEIGIRMALGAERFHVVWMVLRETIVLVGLGIGVGVVAAAATTRLVSSMLYGLAATDPATIVVAVTFLGLVAAFAGYLPARRASRLDPLNALRYE